MTNQLIGPDNNFFFYRDFALSFWSSLVQLALHHLPAIFNDHQNSPFISHFLSLCFVPSPDHPYPSFFSLSLPRLRPSVPQHTSFTTASAVAPLSLGTSAIDPALRSSSSQVRDVPAFTSPQEGDGSSSLKFEAGESSTAYHNSSSTAPPPNSFPATTTATTDYPETSTAEYAPSATGLSALASAASDQTSYIRYVDRRNSPIRTGISSSVSQQHTTTFQLPDEIGLIWKFTDCYNCRRAYDNAETSNSNHNASQSVNYATSAPTATNGGQGSTTVSTPCNSLR
ncbi:hypothetical protein H112_05871 [Trichophyton rubrum D6]|uniref:Uncharacterized protein n=3 Tax=Trichophyton TaxID=5550 RepID=F2SKU6_TRIRC|nr:uncharacterized protein TERG_03577 [Trichophyton rubrum CBS 118892]EZF16034.1 hypothetical protein H100_05886 [Trichophyton rubrum MR850]EZF40163.1 hypothetical protein H102_05855 [Trichophyton rubrum CBS 100081]EZF50796.1 hypothetical protein H103_05882 [Trichophyton rubrum CBS 288.86]EZF61392.1 hypothetical protein H104_05868 [Trichophyton rubrum CBS 289.86]EZF71966.1 hypothetical protein H105_05896 [Trichophyton soudanense CBS 452.61]EZF82708.1 hypothetical protein H110_05877 [Trichophy